METVRAVDDPVVTLFGTLLAPSIVVALVTGFFGWLNARRMAEAKEREDKLTAGARNMSAQAEAASSLSEATMKFANELQEQMQIMQVKIRELEEKIRTLEAENAELRRTITTLEEEKADKRKRDEKGRFMPRD